MKQAFSHNYWRAFTATFFFLLNKARRIILCVVPGRRRQSVPDLPHRLLTSASDGF